MAGHRPRLVLRVYGLRLDRTSFSLCLATDWIKIRSAGLRNRIKISTFHVFSESVFSPDLPERTFIQSTCYRQQQGSQNIKQQDKPLLYTIKYSYICYSKTIQQDKLK